MTNETTVLTLALAAGAAMAFRPNRLTIPIAEQPLYDAYDALKVTLRAGYPQVDFESLAIGPGSPARLAQVDQQVRQSGALHDELVEAQLEAFLGELTYHAPEAASAVGLILPR